MVNNDEDFEIGSVENFGGQKDKEFSHSSLVMTSMRKCLDAGAKEMRDGWFNEKVDKNGFRTRTYVEDTRKAFIESVRSLKMIMACDLDKTSVKRIKEYLLRIKRKEKEYIKEGNDAWEKLSAFEKAQYLKSGQRHFFKIISHPLLKKYFIEYELEQWRNIFAELSRLTKRLDFFKADVFEA